MKNVTDLGKICFCILTGAVAIMKEMYGEMPNDSPIQVILLLYYTFLFQDIPFKNRRLHCAVSLI
jgi:hypothetical protein